VRAACKAFPRFLGVRLEGREEERRRKRFIRGSRRRFPVA
jgi:hypothetical protein